MIKIEIEEAEGYHKFLVTVIGKTIWAHFSNFLTAEKAEEKVKNFCRQRKEEGEKVEIVADPAVLKKLGL